MGSFGLETRGLKCRDPIEPGSTAWKAVVRGWRPMERRTPDFSKVGIQWQPRLVPELTAKWRIGSEVPASLGNSGSCPRAGPLLIGRRQPRFRSEEHTSELQS